MKIGSIAKLFSELGYDWEKMPINEKIDVSNKECYIQSYDTVNNEIVHKLVKNIIRKSNSIGYNVELSNDKSFACTGKHLLLVPSTGGNKWASAEELYQECLSSGYIYCVTGPNSNDLLETHIEKLQSNIPVLDLEVEETNCYFSEGLISHNTMFGSPETVSGGNALKFYSSMRVRVSRLAAGSDGVTTNRTKVKFVKNKLGVPFGEAEFNLVFGQGIDRTAEIIEQAASHGIINQSSSWYEYAGNRTQGIQAMLDLLNTNPELLEEIESKLDKVFQEG